MNNYKQQRPPESKKAAPPNQGYSAGPHGTGSTALRLRPTEACDATYRLSKRSSDLSLHHGPHAGTLEAGESLRYATALRVKICRRRARSSWAQVYLDSSLGFTPRDIEIR